MKLKRPAEALASYDRAIALKPDYAEAHNNRGNALRDLKRPEEALASYDRAIALKPDFACGAQQSRQCAEGPEASCGSAGKLRQGDRAQARLCRRAQQSRQCAEGPEASRGSAGKLRQGDRAQARLRRGAQQSRQCADGPEASAEALASYDKAIALKPIMRMRTTIAAKRCRTSSVPLKRWRATTRRSRSSRTTPRRTTIAATRCGPEASRGGAGKLREGDRAEARL